MYFPILNEDLFGTPESSKSPGRKMPGQLVESFGVSFSVFGAGGKKWAQKALGGHFFGGGGLIEIRGIPKEKRMYLENYW